MYKMLSGDDIDLTVWPRTIIRCHHILVKRLTQ